MTPCCSSFWLDLACMTDRTAGHGARPDAFWTVTLMASNMAAQRLFLAAQRLACIYLWLVSLPLYDNQKRSPTEPAQALAPAMALRLQSGRAQVQQGHGTRLQGA